MRDAAQVLDAREEQVSPPTTAAAGLNTALTGYGQSAAVRIGFPACRSNSSRLLTRHGLDLLA